MRRTRYRGGVGEEAQRVGGAIRLARKKRFVATMTYRLFAYLVMCTPDVEFIFVNVKDHKSNFYC
jgi:hypothetical protein